MALLYLGVADGIVFGLSFLVSMLVGLYHAYKRRNSTTEYFLAGRKMAALPVALSFLVTYESSVFVMGYPAEVYIHGFTFWFYNVGHAISMLIVSRITPKLFYPLGLKSVYEYFYLRYGNQKVRLLTVLLASLRLSIYIGIVLIGPAIALRSLSDIPEWGTIMMLTATAVLYSTLGGIKAVIWTDVFQFIVMVVGIIAILIKGTLDAGGVMQVFEVNKVSGRLDIEFNPNPFIRHSVWTLMIGSGLRLIGIGLSPSGVQRSNSTRSERDAVKMFYLSILGFIGLPTLAMLVGLVAFAFFAKQGCDPLRSDLISNPNEIVPLLIVQLFGSVPGLAGLFLATLTSASLSTISSLLNNIAAIITEDLVKPAFRTIPDTRLTLIAKAVVPLAGLLGMGIAFLTLNAKGSLNQIAGSILGALGGPVTGLFLLAIFYTGSTTEGALVSGILGISFAMWLTLGYNMSPTRLVTPWLPLGPVDKCPATNTTHMEPLLFNNSRLLTAFHNSSSENHMRPGPAGVDWLYSVSYQYFGLMAITLTVSVGIAISLMSRKLLRRYRHRPEVEKKYTLSLAETFLCCIPRICKPAFFSETERTSSTEPKTMADVTERLVDMSENQTGVTQGAGDDVMNQGSMTEANVNSTPI